MAFRRQSRQRTNILVVCAFTLFLWFTFRSSFFSSSPQPRVPPVKIPGREPPLPPPPPPADSKPEIKHRVEPKVQPKVEPDVKTEQKPEPKAQAVLEPPKGKGLKKHGEDDVEMVIASMQRENVTWLHDYLTDWKKNIYVVDDPKARLTVPTNKGREAMVFLTYIIDRYDSLPGNILFHHAERFQWHNDNPDYDALTLLQRFRFDNLKEQGYVNLRCVWVLGCPAEIHPIKDESPPVPNEAIHARHVYKPAFEELFPNTPVPETIGVTCCSQFAVRREVIKKRPRADYVRYRDWLMTSDLPDDLSGRVLEYSWHVMFGKNAVHCPNAGDCYCRTYGLCDLKCDERGCGSQYTLPRFSTLPKGWPKIGWEGEDRHWSGPE